MKSLKIIFLALGLLIAIGLVVYFSDPSSSVFKPEHESTLKDLNENTDKNWKDLHGWKAEAYDDCADRILRKKEDNYITSEEADNCLNHLNEVALNKTSAALDSMYASPSCSKSSVDSQITGIQKIAQNEKYASDAEVKKQLAIYREYTAALTFAASSCRESTGYSFPYRWNTFSGNGFRARANAIKAGRYWNVIKEISVIKNGLSESTVNSKISQGRAAFASTLASQIVSAFSSRPYTYDNYDLLLKARNNYNSSYSNSSLNSFCSGYHNRIDE